MVQANFPLFRLCDEENSDIEKDIFTGKMLYNGNDSDSVPGSASLTAPAMCLLETIMAKRGRNRLGLTSRLQYLNDSFTDKNEILLNRGFYD